MDYADYDIVTGRAGGLEAGIAEIVGRRGTADRGRREAVILVVEDGIWMSQEFEAICEFLEIAVVRVSRHDDLARELRTRAPMAVVCELDGVGQDGCHVMKTVASHDRSLPILMVTSDDPILIGAAEAVEELWRMTEVTKLETLPGIAGLVDFLFHAGRKGGCLRLMPART